MLNLSIATAAALAIGLVSTRADDRFDYTVRLDFFAGFAGNQAALERGMKACEDILAKNPKHAEAMVWHGSGLLALSGQAFQKGDPQKGAELWARGVKQMDEAVALEPGKVAVLAPRGAAYTQASIYVPPDMGKPILEKGLQDYERILEIQKPYFQELGVHPRGEVLYGLAHGWYRLGNQDKARAYFERIVTDLPGSEYKKRAKLWLETKTLEKAQMRCIGCHTK